MINKYILIIALLLSKFTLKAQVIQLLMNPNPPTLASDWLKSPYPVKFIIISPVAGAGPFKVQGIVSRGGSPIITTKLEFTNSVILSKGTNLYKASDFWTINSFDLGFSDINFTTGKLKPDVYSICVNLIDANGQKVGSTSCSNVQITDYQEPTLIIPQADAVIQENQLLGNLNFRWSPVTPSYSGIVKYKFEIFEVPDNLNPLQALAGMPIESDIIFVNQKNAINFKAKFDQRKTAGVNTYRYAWRVQSIDGTTNEPIGKNAGTALGYSELRMFTVATTISNTISNKAPVSKPKTSPTSPQTYKEPTLTALKSNEKLEAEAAFKEIKFKWTPVTPQYPSLVKYQLSIYIKQGNENERVILSKKPYLSKELSGDTTYSWKCNKYFSSETEFIWRVKAVDSKNKGIGIKSGANLGFSETGHFSVKVPNSKEAVPILPAKNSNLSFDQLKKGVEFKWKSVTPSLSKKNKYILNIYAKTSKNKDSLINTITLTDSLKYTWKNTTLTKEGTYFWNITSKDSANNLIGIKKKGKGISEDFTFLIKSSSKEDSVVFTDCDGNRRVIKTTVKTGTGNIDFLNQFITVNTFKMLVKELTKSSNNNNTYTLSGKGSIMIPWLKTPIYVEFTDINVSGSSKEVTSGSVFAIQDETLGDIPKLLKGNSSQKVTKAQAENLNKRLKDDASNKMVSNQNIENNLQNVGSSSIPKLPMGLNNVFDYTLAITEMKFSPQANQLVCVAVLPYNKDDADDVIAFAATDITFDINSPSKGGGKLALIEDFNIVDPADESYGITLKAKHKNNLATYIEWDCKGFKLLKTTVEVGFPRNWLTPVSEDEEEVSDTVKVKGFATADIYNLKDWMLTLSLDKCEINGLDGSELEINSIVFDNSDQQNPTDIKFPAGYTGVKDKTFRGFYISNASLVLPKFYNKSTDTTGINIVVDNFIISKQGVSGKIEVGAKETPIVNLETGTVGDFQASLDQVSITILNKSVTKAQVSGRMVLPISKSTIENANTLNYAASWNGATKKKGARIQLEITPEGPLNAELFAGGVLDLNTTSIVRMEYIKKRNKNGKDTIKAEVKFDGNISITKTLMDKIPVNFVMGFENLGFDFNNAKARKFEMKPTTFSFASPQKKAGGFPVTINGIEITDDPSSPAGYLASAQLKFNLNLNLGTNISGTTAIKITGGIKKNNGKYIPELISANIDSIKVDAKVAAVDLKGSLVFYSKDPVYGDGFKGDISAVFAKVGTVMAAVQFGNVPQEFPGTGTYDYWFAEAKLILAKPIPMINPIGLKGGGIGAWHHMTASAIPLDTNAIKDPAREENSNRCGSTFTPNENIGLGFRITGIIVNVQSDKVFNGDVTFTAEFNNNFGINLIRLGGSMYMGAGINERDLAMVKGEVTAQYDFGNERFDLNASLSFKIPKQAPDNLAFIKTSKPITFILMIDSKNKKGNDPTWKLEIGTPTIPCEIDFRPGIMPIIPAKFYLRAGNTLDPKTGFWQSTIDGVKACGGQIDNPPFTVSDNTVPNGGFDFGIGFIAKGEASCGPFYGNYMAGAEVFMAIQKSAPGGCVTDKFGYWYANGGIAAFATAEIGFRGLVTVGMAGTGHMTGGGPDPIWLKGGISGRVKLKILFVNLNFDANVPFEYGTPCFPTKAFSLDNADLSDLIRVSIRDYSTTPDNTLKNKINNTITSNVDDQSPIVVSSLFPLKKMFSIEMADAKGVTTTFSNYRMGFDLMLQEEGKWYVGVASSNHLRWHQTTGANGPSMSYAYEPCIMPLNDDDHPGIHDKYFNMNGRFNYVIGKRTCWNVSRIRPLRPEEYTVEHLYRNFLFETLFTDPKQDPFTSTHYMNKTYLLYGHTRLSRFENVFVGGNENGGYNEIERAVYFPAEGLPGSKMIEMTTEPIRFTTKSPNR
jgi:hypothetical protein